MIWIHRLEQRHPVWHKFSPSYLATQKRLAWILSIPHQLRYEAFEERASVREWTHSTKAVYWTALLTVYNSLGQETTPEDKRISHLYESNLALHQTAYPCPMIVAHILEVKNGTYQHSLILAITFAFIAGQRISDVLQLSAEDIYLLPENVLAVTFRRGKVVPQIGAFTIFLTSSTQEAMSLLQLALQRTNQFLFSQENSDKERTILGKQIREILVSVDESLEQRSIRRGGLQLMGQVGFPVERILMFSKHRTTEMLMRYLSNGRDCRALQIEQMQVTDVTSTRVASGLTVQQ